MRKVIVFSLVLAAFVTGVAPVEVAHAQGRNRGRRGQNGVFHTNVPPHAFDVILGRLTRTSVTASVLAYRDMEGYIEYGSRQTTYSHETELVRLNKGAPVEIVVAPLKPDAPYYYRFCYRRPGEADFSKTEESTFHTQRPPGATFTFTVQADSHLDELTSGQVYKRTLANALAAQPDFHIDLGDTFMTDKRRNDYTDALPQYLAQRYYFGLLCHSAPLFMVLGNHDGEGGFRYDGTPNSMSAWSIRMRKRYFPNPYPDGFYTGNGVKDKVVGLLEDYYAFEWGDGLFVVLDPFWSTTASRGPDEDYWYRTLGERQYRWLKKTLEESQARFKFVFIHHLVGGKDRAVRGGVASAKYFEWGGYNLDGSYGFKQHRPGWELPIHQLLVKNNVSIVFHGHDHLFAKEELDGIVYQEVPQPAHSRHGNTRNAQEYGYVHGQVLGNSGHVRVTVSTGGVEVAYVRSFLPKDEIDGRKNGDVGASYAIRRERQ